MLTLNMLGHVYVSQEGKALQISHKGAALLSYLALEKQSFHREHLADLLWDHPAALRNLRVELSRLKQQGISPFVARQPMLSLNCTTDLDMLLKSSERLTGPQLPGWLAHIRGAPLSGIEDVGSVHFKCWVDQQRWSITNKLESMLGNVYQRFWQQGEAGLLNLIRERAQRLDLRLNPEDLPEPPPNPNTELATGELIFAYPEQEEALRRISKRAAIHPQLVCLQGCSGSKRQMVNAAFQNTPWHVVQIQVSAQRSLFQGALLQHLARLVPNQSAQIEVLRPSGTAEGEDLDLVRMSHFLTQAGVPVVLVLHLDHPEQWLAYGLRYALNLPDSLMVVLTSGSARVLNEMKQMMGSLDWSQTHHLVLPAIGGQGVLRAFQQAGQIRVGQIHVGQIGVGQALTGQTLAEQVPGLGSPETPQVGDLHHQAVTLAQVSDGWPLYLQTLATQGLGPHQPEQITGSVLANRSALSSSVREGLSKLAQVHERFDLKLAETLLGDMATEVMRVGTQQGLLVPAAPLEEVELPALATWTNDLEPFMGFVNEPVRVALASQLAANERHTLRGQLAHLFRQERPSLSASYAERAGMREFAATVRAEVPELTMQEVNSPAAQLVDAPPLSLRPRRELRTSNGYRVGLENGYLEVLRRGRQGASPLLVLRFWEVPAGRWAITGRVDIFRNTLQAELPPPYVLGLGTNAIPDAAPDVIYSTQAVFAPETKPEYRLGQLPQGRWFRIAGESQGGPLCLTVRGMDVALTIGRFTWNNQNLL